MFKFKYHDLSENHRLKYLFEFPNKYAIQIEYESFTSKGAKDGMWEMIILVRTDQGLKPLHADQPNMGKKGYKTLKEIESRIKNVRRWVEPDYILERYKVKK